MAQVNYEIKELLAKATFYHSNQRFNDSYKDQYNNCVQAIKDKMLDQRLKSYDTIEPYLFVEFSEVLLRESSNASLAEVSLQMYFDKYSSEDQYRIQAYLCKALLKSYQLANLKAEEMIEKLTPAFEELKNALNIISQNKQKYQFMIYNASLVCWKIVRGIARPIWSRYASDIVEKIAGLLEETDDPDYSWRCWYYTLQAYCTIEAEKKPEPILDKLWDLTKKKGECDFQETIYRMRIHFYKTNAGVQGNIKKDGESIKGKIDYKYLVTLQQIKSEAIPAAMVEKELSGVISALCKSAIAFGEDKIKEEDVALDNITQSEQDRLAEAGRIAIKYGYYKWAQAIISAITHARKVSLKAKLLCEYSKAELLVKCPRPDTNQKGMVMTIAEKELQDIQLRSDALKIMERCMVANSQLNDCDVIIEGCYIIWNISVPLLKRSTRKYTYKSMQTASNYLEEICSNDNILRVSIYLELAQHEITEDYLAKASAHIKRALELDYSITSDKLKIELTDEDDIAEYQRVYEKILRRIDQKIDLKVNIYKEPETVIEQVLLDVENARLHKQQKSKEDLLRRSFKRLKAASESLPEYKADSKLTQEEIDIAKKAFAIKTSKRRKLCCIIFSDISKLSMEVLNYELTIESGLSCLAYEWSDQKDSDLLVKQAEASYSMSQAYAELIMEKNSEVGSEEYKEIEQSEEPTILSDEDKKNISENKAKFFTYIEKGFKYAESSTMSYLVFNGAIIFWNVMLPICRLCDFTKILHHSAEPLFKLACDLLSAKLPICQFDPKLCNYTVSQRASVLANLSYMYALLLQSKSNTAESIKLCDNVLSKQLPLTMKKPFDALKAKLAKTSSKSSAQPKAAVGKGKKAEETKQKFDPTSEVSGMLELVEEMKEKTQKEANVKQMIDLLKQWQINEKDEEELQMHAELWTKVCRIACLEGGSLLKLALLCAETVFSLKSVKIDESVPSSRLRWYSIARALYGEVLTKLVDKKTQERSSQEKLLLNACNHYTLSAKIASLSGIGFLVIESAKQMWNSLIPLLDSEYTRRQIIAPMREVASYVYITKDCSDPEFLSLYYSALFMCITEQKQWELGSALVVEAFEFFPETHQRFLWEAKMLYASKLGRNVMNEIANMKESNPILQAKIWLKLARSTSNVHEQFPAYLKCLELLKKEEAIEASEIYLEIAEWMKRNNYNNSDIEDVLILASDMLMDIEIAEDEEEDEKEGDEKSVSKSRKSRQSKKSGTSKNSKSKQSKKSQATRKSRVSQSKKSSSAARSSTHSKSTVSKTTFAKLAEEESQPSYLNCMHYDRLFRLHFILSQISSSALKQREHLEECVYFLRKIWSQSFTTLNALLYSAEHPAVLQGKDLKAFISTLYLEKDISIPQKLVCPVSDADWVVFKRPKELDEWHVKYEGKELISKWIFMKPRISFYCLNQLLSLLEEHYSTIHMIPVLHTLIFHSKVVNQNETLSLLYEIKLKRLLFSIGYTQSAESIDVTPFILSEESKALEFEKAQRLEKGKEFVYLSKEEPWILEMTFIHEHWLMYAEELAKWGYYLEAKGLLNEVLRHSAVLNDYNRHCAALIMMSELLFIEGQYEEALKCDMKAQKVCVRLEDFGKCIYSTVSHLNAFRKYDDIDSLLIKAIQVFEKQYQNTYKDKITPMLAFILEQVYMISGWVKVKEAKHGLNAEKESQLLNEAFELFTKFENVVNVHGIRGKEVALVLKFIECLNKFSIHDITFQTQKLALVSNRIERTIKYLSKCLKWSSEFTLDSYVDELRLSLPGNRLTAQIKLGLSQLNTTIGILKNTLANRVSKLHQEESKKTSEGAVQIYIDELSKQIEKLKMPTQKKLNRYEIAISLLQSALLMPMKNTPQHYHIQLHLLRSRRMLSLIKNALGSVWKQAEVLEEKEDSDCLQNYISTTMSCLYSIMENDTIPTQIIHNPNLLQLLSLEGLELRGSTNERESFYFLSLLQHSRLISKLRGICNSASSKISKNIVNNRKYKDMLNSFSDKFLPPKNSKAEYVYNTQFTTGLKNFYETTSKEDMENLLPCNSLYVIIQLSANMDCLYIGALKITEERKLTFKVQKIVLSNQNIESLTKLKEKLANMKISLLRKPISIPKEIQELHNACEKDLTEAIAEINNFFGPMLSDIDKLINQPPQPDSPPPEATEVKEAKKDEKKKDEKKKDSKKEAKKEEKKKQAKEKKQASKKQEAVIIQPTKGGIESVLLSVDWRLLEIPFESMSLFNDVKVLSYDISMHSYCQRLKKVDYSVDYNSNKGIAKESIKAIVDLSIDTTLGASIKGITSKLTTKFSSTNEIIYSDNHVAGVGEWERAINTADLFVYYGIPTVLHKFSPSCIAEICNYSDPKSLIIFERMNTLKTLVDRNSFTNSSYMLNDQPLQTIMLLLSSSPISICINRYSLTPEQNIGILDAMIETASEGKYLTQYKEKLTEKTQLEKNCFVNFGVAQLKIG